MSQPAVLTGGGGPNEARIWFEGVPRLVAGITPRTKVQELILALAKATGRIGRYTLQHELSEHGPVRTMDPNECPFSADAVAVSKRGRLLLTRADLQETGSAPTPTAGTTPATPPVDSEDLRRKLAMHLVYQEQEIEYNRLKLRQLDRELAWLQLGTLDGVQLEQRLVAQAAALAQLEAAAPAAALVAERQRQTRLREERQQWEGRLQQLSQGLEETRDAALTIGAYERKTHVWL